MAAARIAEEAARGWVTEPGCAYVHGRVRKRQVSSVRFGRVYETTYATAWWKDGVHAEAISPLRGNIPDF